MDDVRYGSACVLLVAGIVVLLRPNAASRGQRLGALRRRLWLRQGLEPERVDRLERAFTARESAEASSVFPNRIVGAIAILAAPLELVRSIDFIVPYALVCLAAAVAELVRYLGIGRATERRVASLTRRSPLDSLTYALVASVAASFTGTAIYAAIPAHRAASLMLLLYIAVLTWVAWQVAASPAALQGDDPELEYSIDAWKRQWRVAGFVLLACWPPWMLVVLTYQSAPAGLLPYSYAALVLVSIGIVLRFFASPRKKQISDSLGGAA